MLPRFETKISIQNEITRLNIDAARCDEIGFYPEPNRYLGIARRIRTILTPELHRILNSEEYQ